jgi:predicted amidohydrolase YtcJ
MDRLISSSRLVAYCTGLLYAVAGFPQIQVDQRLVNYPDTVFINGNVISMDDEGVNENVGSTYEAIAIRDGRILALDSTTSITQLIGVNTRVYDLNGRTIIPGIIDTHSHPHGNAVGHWGQPDQEGYIRYTIDEIPKDSRENMDNMAIWKAIARKTLDLAAEIKDKHPAGEWIFIDWPRRMAGVEMVKDTALSVHRVLTRHMLDEVNTVHNIVIPGNRGVVNTPAMEVYRSYFGGEHPDMYDDGVFVSTTTPTLLAQELRPMPYYMDIIEQEFLEWAAYGTTTISSRIELYNITATLKALDKAGRIPIRFAYGVDAYWFQTTPNLPEFLTDLSGVGSDWLWVNGASITSGDGAFPLFATSIEARPEIKEREILRERISFVKDYAARGLRWTNTHIAGDRTLDVAMDMLEEGSRQANMTPAEIKEKRHTSDHCRLNPRPEQLPRLRDLGIIMSCAPKYIWDDPDIIRDYGLEYTEWVVPMRSLIESGVRTVFEIDTHEVAAEGVFFHIGQYVNRIDREGNVNAPNQRINRTWALKTATSWASYYVLKENVLGTLEEGKFADFLILNKNYFDQEAVPDPFIKTVRPLMTVIGGHIRYLDPELADELRATPVGIHPEMVVRTISQWEHGNLNYKPGRSVGGGE